MKKLAGLRLVGWCLMAFGAVSAVSSQVADEPSVLAVPTLSPDALSYWAEKDGDSWFVPVFLQEVENDIGRLAVPPEQAVAATARHFSLDPKQAVALVEAEVRAAALFDTQVGLPSEAASDPLEVAERVESAVHSLREPVERWRLLIRFYGKMSTYMTAVPEGLETRGVDIVAEAFEAGRVEEVWDVVETSGLPQDEIFHRLLAAAPGHPWPLRKIADSTWDALERGAVRLHLMGHGESSEGEALRDLLYAGAARSAVELWQSLPERPDLSDQDEVGRYAGSMTAAMAAALWLEGHSDEAAELLRTAPTIQVGEVPKLADDGGGHEEIYNEREKWLQRSEQALQQQLLREGLRPSGQDAYELALALLRIRESEPHNNVLTSALWPMVAARWAQTAGHEALERFFLVSSLGRLAHRPTQEAQSRMLHWSRALAEGWISVSLFEQREALYRETLAVRELAIARVEALAGTSAGYYPFPERVDSPRPGIGWREIERIASPFRVRALGVAASRQWIEREESSASAAQETLDAGELPPTLPVLGGQVVSWGRDGSRWWVLHQGEPGVVVFGGESPWRSRAYWLSLSHDGGHSWSRPVHTGLLPGSPLQLLENGTTVRRGELIVRGKNQPWSGYGIGLQLDDDSTVFELVVDLDDLQSDEDGDGWTDVMELGLATDPDSEDTDGDGLSDPEDPLPLTIGGVSTESRALAAILRGAMLSDSLRAATPGKSRGRIVTVRLFGPDLPMSEIPPLQIVLLPEELAHDDRYAGVYERRIRLWMMNREGNRAFLSWTGSDYGSLEYVEGPNGWVPYAGYEGGGCVVTRIEPSEEAKAAAAEL